MKKINLIFNGESAHEYEKAMLRNLDNGYIITMSDLTFIERVSSDSMADYKEVLTYGFVIFQKP